MTVTIDLQVAELLASRLCHDLVGPVGAVNNGLELLQEDDFDMAEEAVALAGKSAEQAATVLQFFRMAYGMAGNRQGSDLAPLRDLATRYLAHTKVSLDWPAEPAPDGAPEGLGKLLLNMIELGLGGLPRGGTLGVSLGRGDGVIEAEIKVVGAGAGLRDEDLSALSDSIDVEALSPRNVHGYFTRMLARRLGGDLSCHQAGAGFIQLVVQLPA